MCFRTFTSAGAEKNIYRAELAVLRQKKNVFWKIEYLVSKNTRCPGKTSCRRAETHVVLAKLLVQEPG